VADHDGKQVPSLIASDFIVTRGGATVGGIDVAEETLQTRKAQALILLDCSGSTQGAPLQGAKEGATLLINSLSSKADFKVVAFGSAVWPLTPWTSDPKLAASSFSRLASQGNTALLAALEHGALDIQSRDEPRVLIVFSDGKDTVGGKPTTALLNRYKESRTQIHAIGLETRELDGKFLGMLSSETGGSYVTASRASELVECFKDLSRLISQPIYRVSFPEQGSGPIQLTIGGKNSVSLEVPVP
jgi:Mg-chelatase subunit ChlD